MSVSGLLASLIPHKFWERREGHEHGRLGGWDGTVGGFFFVLRTFAYGH